MIANLNIGLSLTILAPALLSVAFVPANAAVRAPQYAAGISVDTDAGYVDDGSPLRVGYPLFGDAPVVSPNAVDLSFQHNSVLRTSSTGTAYAGPENGGTVRAIASTDDETIGAQAGLNYTFQLRPKPGVVLPDVISMHVFAIGDTGSENYGGGRITFILDWFDSLSSHATIFKDTGVTSTPGGIDTFGGDGSIHVDEDIDVVLNRDVSVQLAAYASAGIPVTDQDLLLDEYGTGSAHLDPIFTLPAAYRDLIEIVGVPAGATPPPPGPGDVPEPATWAMMLSGFGLIGSAMRRRRARRWVALEAMPDKVIRSTIGTSFLFGRA
jgi:hypothetical protein